MSTPHRDDEPDEPVDGVAADHRSPEDEPADQQREPTPTPTDDDAVWQAIVANYGDRAQLEDTDPAAGSGAVDRGAPDPRSRLGHPAGTGRPEAPRVHEPDGSDASDGSDGSDSSDGSDLARGPEERFVPPSPPPLPLPRPARLVAWLGVLGVPVAVLLTLLVGLSVPSWAGTVLMVWFVGGFAYLVARMRRDHHDPGDGAVV